MNRSQFLGHLGLRALVLAALSVVGSAQIQRMTLEDMVQASDSAVYGQITASHVVRRDSPIDGPELYYTTITIQGITLSTGQPITVDVTFHGGFISETEGVYNSEAPAADDVKVGKKVVAFYQWVDDLGGGMPCNAMTAEHGGVFRTIDGPRGAAVLGRGPGFAIEANVRLAQLEESVRQIAATKPPKKH